MEFTWDERKRLINLRDHKLDFQDAWMVFNGLEYTSEDNRFQYPERRYNTIGFLGERIVRITYSCEKEIYRVISLRKASNREASEFIRAIRQRGGLENN